MLKKFYESVLDVELYCRMADLIYRLSEHKNKEYLYDRLKNEALFLEKQNWKWRKPTDYAIPGKC